jgi:hypothetical protein
VTSKKKVSETMNHEFLMDRMHTRLVGYAESFAGEEIPREMRSDLNLAIGRVKRWALMRGEAYDD